MNRILFLFYHFTFFAFIGWIVESAYRTVREHNGWINSGFLYGPVIPIYGFGATLIGGTALIFAPLPLIARLALFSLLATTLEYGTSLMMEKLFGLRLWDYSAEKFNLKGRVCLKYSLFWVILSAAYQFIFYPLFTSLWTILPIRFHLPVGLLILSLFLADAAFSFGAYRQFGRMFRSLVKLSGFDRLELEKLDLPHKKIIRALSIRAARIIRSFPHTGFQWMDILSFLAERNETLVKRWIRGLLTEKVSESDRLRLQFQRMIKRFRPPVLNQERDWITFRLGKILKLRSLRLFRKSGTEKNSVDRNRESRESWLTGLLSHLNLTDNKSGKPSDSGTDRIRNDKK